jgi:predicted O-methyltransferase YrrM
LRYVDFYFRHRPFNVLAVLALLGGICVWVAGRAFGGSGSIPAATFISIGAVGAIVLVQISQLRATMRQLYTKALLDDALMLPGIWQTATQDSASADSLLTMYRLVRQRKSGNIVELGSGVSTLVLARAAQQNGVGIVISVESDAAYMSAVKEVAIHVGLSAYIEFVHAELVSSPGSPGRVWYDMGKVLSQVPSVDLLVVDGPEASLHERVREPALDVFSDRLTPGAIVLLDDANRGGERKVLLRWREKYPRIVISRVDTERGLGVVTWPADGAQPPSVYPRIY